MHLSEIYIYPVKSLKGISLSEAQVEDRGLRLDRRWMLVDDKNQFLTQREFPRMAIVNISVDRDSLTAAIEDSKKIIPFFPNSNENASVKIWKSRVRARVYAAEINEWFSEMIGTKCRLVLMPEEVKRKVDPFYAVRKFKNIVSFADGYPFLLIGEGSLRDLNSKLETPLPMNRFRPNLVVKESQPFAEDGWKKIKIGEKIFHVVKPCDRCIITTVDQETGERNGKEPLKTLSTYRNRNGKVLFGQNLIAENPGASIRVGDKVEVIENK